MVAEKLNIKILAREPIKLGKYKYLKASFDKMEIKKLNS